MVPAVKNGLLWDNISIVKLQQEKSHSMCEVYGGYRCWGGTGTSRSFTELTREIVEVMVSPTWCNQQHISRCKPLGALFSVS